MEAAGRKVLKVGGILMAIIGVFGAVIAVSVHGSGYGENHGR